LRINTEAIRLNPEYSDAYYNRRVAYGLKGDKIKATADAAECEVIAGAAEDNRPMLPAAEVRHIVRWSSRSPLKRIYGAWWGRAICRDGKAAGSSFGGATPAGNRQVTL